MTYLMPWLTSKWLTPYGKDDRIKIVHTQNIDDIQEKF
jgi:hypothetical protein